MKKASKIHKEYVGGVTPFNDWITVEKVHYGELKNDSIGLDMSFDSWLNEKYKINGKEAWLNADGDVNDANTDKLNNAQSGNKEWYDKAINMGWLGLNVYDRFKDVTDTTETEQADLVNSDEDASKKSSSTKIFGLNKTIVYGLGAVAIVGVGFWAYKKYGK